jgi:hypothetical protein
VSRREDLGRIVRETWVKWALGQPDPKPSWLTGWDDLDAGQREVDMLIGSAVAAAADEGAVSELDEPLTHFFHCWRFPDHHRCAVALIERQSQENDQLLVRAAAAERALRDERAGEGS